MSAEVGKRKAIIRSTPTGGDEKMAPRDQREHFEVKEREGGQFISGQANALIK